MRVFGAAFVAAASLATPASATTSITARGAHNAPKGSSGCGSPAVAGSTTQMLNVAGAPRQYRLAVPSEPTGKRPLPLILNFHGTGSDATFQAAYSQLEEKGPARGFVVATPKADPPYWDRRDTDPKDNWVAASDANLAFTNALIDDTAARLCIDLRRVHAAGFSNGAAMSAYLGCKRSRQIAAIAPVSGINGAEPCPHGKAISVLTFQGTADPRVPFGGGRYPRPPRPDATLPSVEAAVGAWAQRDRCGTKPARQPIGTEVQRITYRGCRSGNAVV